MNDKHFSVDQLCLCAKREVAQRKRVYRRLVSQGTMTEQSAEREIAMMQAIADYFEDQTQPKLL